MHIDRHLQYYQGFNYLGILRAECQTIFPNEFKITLGTPLEDCCQPLKNFIYNIQVCQNPIIGVALMLVLIRRIVISIPELRGKDIDWSPMINCIWNGPVDLVQSRINQAGIAIRDTYAGHYLQEDIDEEDGYELPE